MTTKEPTPAVLITFERGTVNVYADGVPDQIAIVGMIGAAFGMATRMLGVAKPPGIPWLRFATVPPPEEEMPTPRPRADKREL